MTKLGRSKRDEVACTRDCAEDRPESQKGRWASRADSSVVSIPNPTCFPIRLEGF
jgi:hypothetical protein